MTGDIEGLSERERETLRLLGRGHEAKSIASALGLSVHTVNERLRGARRKLGVSSSREAARLLLAHESRSEAPDNLAYKEFRVAHVEPDAPHRSRAHPGATGGESRLKYIVIGAVMLIILSTILLSVSQSGNDASAPATAGRAALPKSPLAALFIASDYPAEALTTGVQGNTGIRLRVSDKGRVEKCDVERSSGSAALDQAACRVVTSRARFHPALSAAGRPVASHHSDTIRWMLRE